MIASLRGTVQACTGATLVLEVAGIGYRLAVTPQHAASLTVGGDAFVHTAMIVRDDELVLCGFESAVALEVFDLLRSVSGVGPKSALGVLAQLTPAQVAAAVAAEDDAAFRRVSGIGPKTAKLIVIALQGRLAELGLDAAAVGDPPSATTAAARARDETVTALVGLGFPERRAEEAVDELIRQSPEASAQQLLRLALASLGAIAGASGARR